MALISAGHLVEKLTQRFGLSFSHAQEDFDGEVFIVVRADDLLRPNGFGVTIARTPRRVEASLKMDRFSRGLLRRMGEADSVARGYFAMWAEMAANENIRVSVSVNGIPADDLGALTTDEWRMLEIDCDAQLPRGPLSDSDLNDQAATVLQTCFGLALSLILPEDSGDVIDDSATGLPEGAKSLVEVNKYERSRTNRASCIAYHGTDCKVCGINFGLRYGAIGIGYIEVHHKVPVSAMGGEYRINPKADLIPVCGNCHSMLHRRDPPYSVEELQEIINSQNTSQ